MQYVRSIGGSVSKTWNSINPATLSGAIDVIVVEQEDGMDFTALDGSLACSPFHVRFGKFSLLRPYEKKAGLSAGWMGLTLIKAFYQVAFSVNDVKQNHAMKLGEGGEAFFVFETSDDIPESLQTSPVISPAASPQNLLQDPVSPQLLQEPEFLDLNINGVPGRKIVPASGARPMMSDASRAKSDFGALTPVSSSPDKDLNVLASGKWPASQSSPQMKRSASEEILPLSTHPHRGTYVNNPEDHNIHGGISLPNPTPQLATSAPSERSVSPPPAYANEAINRAKSLSEKLSGSNIPTHVTDSGDLMLDMTGYKSSEEEALRAEIIARKILADELEGNYDIGALIGADGHGNVWIYSSEEAKEAAARKIGLSGLSRATVLSDAASDPGYQSDEENATKVPPAQVKHQRTQSDAIHTGLATPPQTPPADVPSSGDPNRNYAKTLRLTSDQLRALNLKTGANTMSFSVNRAICQAHMYYWKYDVPIVISDIDGTITKSDALGHVLNMIGRDWTHIGVAKLYADIVANGYNILYLTSRSVGQADTTRTYLNGVSQEGFKLPKGPVIMSPDRTIAALRREIYLRKPEVFKMACLRDILNLFSQKRNPFYAGFGNRLTDALSYRSVNIPSTRIFTINSNAEVSLDLLTLNKYKSSYVTMREVVDHFFPPVGLLVTGGGEEFTDFSYWRDAPLEIGDFSDSDSEDFGKTGREKDSIRSEDEGSEGLGDDEPEDEMAESYLSQGSTNEGDDLVDSILESIDDGDFIAERSMADSDGGEIPDTVLDVDLDTPTGAGSGALRASKAHLLQDKAAEVARSAV